jgi:hypothetical protein
VPGRGVIWHVCGAGTAGYAPYVEKDDPEAPERQLVSGISWVPTPFTGTSSRSAKLLFGAEFNAELERGRGTATAPASRESFVEVRDAEAAQESCCRGDAAAA